MTSAPPPPAPWAPPAPVHPRGSSPGRLLLLFVVALLVVVGVGAVISLALSPPPPAANCPDPNVPCERPDNPTLEPGSTAVAASATPRATVFRPGSPLPTFAATPQSTGIVPPTAPPSAVPTAQPPGSTPAATAAPTIPPPTPALAFPVPTPRPPSTAARLLVGATWTSESLGYAFEYDGQIWTVRDEGANGVFLVAARGNVGLTVVGYPAAEVSPRDALQREVDRLTDVIIGFTEEPDAALQLPGTPIIGYEPGVGGVFAGTINTPQGPGPNVSIGLLAASDGQITLLINVTTVDSLREPAFHAVDSILNTVRWPGRPQ